MKRQRGRGRKPGNPGNRSLESNGPEVKIRGSASQIYEKYMQYARDAQTSGDRVKAENFLQHAEHYYRIMAANAPKERPAQNNEQPAENAEAVQGGEQPADAAATSTADPLKVVDQAEDQASESVDAQASDSEAENAASEQESQPKRRRRTRRKMTEEKPAEGDAEARSALDSLAEEQAAIAGE